MILLLDNYDSFSYNLYQMLGELGEEIKVVRNDALTCGEMEALHPDRLVISPGPGWPKDAGRSEEAIRYFSGKLPILGICLGHQAICETFGGTMQHAKRLMHGKQSVVSLDTQAAIFTGLQEKEAVARYHSLVVAAEDMPACLQVIAATEDGEVMAVRHSEYEIYGLQFHPESVLTPHGGVMLQNFLNLTGGRR
ncbi:MAG: aminodeoxychorismate/anthranilate synthase component II [Lachnospiraceae bacterium]|nr:aminodeoxychorismate/anthranilate synthase component II [Lachnospiraceae bacterium]